MTWDSPSGINGWFLLSLQVRVRSQLGPLARNSTFGRNIKDSQPQGLNEKDCIRYFQQMMPQGIDSGMHTSQLWLATITLASMSNQLIDCAMSLKLRISRKQVMKIIAVSRTKHNCKFKAINDEGNLWNILKKIFKYCVFLPS